MAQIERWASTNGRQRGRPRVTVHYAQTLDGRIATRSGNSQWISGDESLRLAHALRASHQAVMVGIGTVLVDNPRLTVRHVPGESPRRIVLDSTLRLPLDTHLLTDAAAPTLVATTDRATASQREAIEAQGVEVVVVEPDALGRVGLTALLGDLAARGIESVLIEGGARLVTTALRENLVDRLVVCIAPKVVGRGIEAVGELDILRLSDAITFSQARFSALGPDMIFEGDLERSNGTSG
jgi:riboflavin-specific deaminase-like protein